MDQSPIVSTQEGKLRGKICFDFKRRQYFSFQGIPYAKPPLGQLRFKAPQPPEPWTGIRDATIEGNICYHLTESKQYAGSEDCLFLNVYIPKLPTGDEFNLKPVMFWIHGGAFYYGSGNTDMFGPDYLISEDVVIVTMNYRFGLLGFLSLEDPTLGVPGNAGLKDQVMALKWLQRNIRQFCGDANNVTIFGQSSGSASVQFLMLSPMAKGLFHKAIMQSGTALDYWTRGQPSAPLIADVLNLDASNEKEILKTLQVMSVEEFLRVQRRIPKIIFAAARGVVGFVVEKQTDEPAFLTEDPMHLLKSGRYTHVPLIIGYTSREGIYFIMYCKNMHGKYKTFKDFERYIPHTLNFQKGSELSKSIAAKIKHVYFGEEEPSETEIDDNYMMQTDVTFLHGMWSSIKYFSMTSTAPVYLYRMSLNSQLNVYKKIGKICHPGVCHGDDLGYLFKTVLTPKHLGNTEKDGIKRFTQLWTNFAESGDPNPKERDTLINITWNPTCKNELNYLDIGENLTIGVNPDAGRMQFWNEIYSISDTNAKL